MLLKTVATPATTVPRSMGRINCGGMAGASGGTLGGFNFPIIEGGLGGKSHGINFSGIGKEGTNKDHRLEVTASTTGNSVAGGREEDMWQQGMDNGSFDFDLRSCMRDIETSGREKLIVTGGMGNIL